MEYHQVASMVAPSYYPGLENPFENATLEGVTSTHTFSFELEADMNPANIHVTAEVGESSIGVDNIASSMLSEVVADTTEEVSVAEFVGHRNQVLLFPNPASDELTCDLTLQEATPVVLMIYSQDGTLQRSFNQGMMSGRSKVTIPIEHLATGIYYVRVVANHAIHTRKFVKQ
jgi:hypothetical protein